MDVLLTGKKSASYRLIEDHLLPTGITINGNQPWDIQVHDERFFGRVLKNSSLSLGESYMEGWWDCERLDEFFFRIMVTEIHNQFTDFGVKLRNIKNYIFNLQTLRRARKVAKVHYDLDNQLYAYMLGPTMAYTCAYWKEAQTLDEAQANKYDLVCRKLGIKAEDQVLELGCGWGGFAKFAAEKYGCQVTSVNISGEQVRFAKDLCKDLPIQIYQTDYRNHQEYNSAGLLFDKVVSIGMCEHIGHKNYWAFMQVVHNQLKPQGLFLLHTIGNNKTYRSLDPWTDKYIFPNGAVPSMTQLGEVIGNFFVMEDWHNFGPDYDLTLMAWHANFERHWQTLSKKFDQRFYRMWVYYLLSCAGTFRARELQLWQIVLSKGRGQQGYETVR